MAQNLQQLKRRIKTSKNVAQIAKAMEMMSASKIKRAQATVESNKPHSEKVVSLTNNLIKRTDLETFHHPFIDGNESKKRLLVVISPDRGLCGSLNTNIFKKLIEVEDAHDALITVGTKVERFAARMSFDLLASFPMGTAIPKYSFVFELAKLIEDLYLKGDVGEVSVLYTKFNSFFSQVPTVKKLLPIKFTEEEGQEADAFLPDALFEPSATTLLEALLPHYFEVEIYEALIQAYTSEQVARMLAMQNAKTNANEIATYLTLAYNKTRQERITSEILDLSNAQVV